MNPLTPPSSRTFKALPVAIICNLLACASASAAPDLPSPPAAAVRTGAKETFEGAPGDRLSPAQMQALIKRLVPSRYVWATGIDGRMLKVAARLTSVGIDDSLYGVVDAQGKEVIPPQYSDIHHVAWHRRFKVTLGQGQSARKGVLDETGKVVVPLVYEHLVPISNMASEPTVVAHQGGKAGYLNIVSGAVLIKPLYDGLSGGGRLTDEKGVGVLVAVKGDKRGLIDTNGRVLTAFEFKGFDNAADGLIGRRAKGPLLHKIHNGQLLSVSPYTVPVSALKSGGPIVGIGVRLQPSADDATAVIEAVAPGGPAAMAKLQPSDKLLEVDGRHVSAMSMEDVVNAIRGEAGSAVKLKVQRGTKTWHLTVTRAPIISP